jgi:hypothetical protein
MYSIVLLWRKEREVYPWVVFSAQREGGNRKGGTKINGWGEGKVSEICLFPPSGLSSLFFSYSFRVHRFAPYQLILTIRLCYLIPQKMEGRRGEWMEIQCYPSQKEEEKSITYKKEMCRCKKGYFRKYPKGPNFLLFIFFLLCFPAICTVEFQINNMYINV